MSKCRKNYANLLLLSVLFFMLSVPVRPVVPADDQTVSWYSAGSSRSFQWEEHSGALIYRGQHLNAAVVHEFNCVPPEVCEIELPDIAGQGRVILHSSAVAQVRLSYNSSRAPPVA